MAKTSRNSMFGRIDWLLVLLFLALTTIGWLHIWSASFIEDAPSPFSMANEAGRQFVWMGISLVAALLIMLTDAKLFPAIRWIIWGLSMVLLASVLVIGQDVAGNKSWIVISGNIKIQPSEFAKYTTALILSGYIGRQEFNGKRWQDWGWSFLIILFPAALVLLQDDLGSTLVFFSFFLALFRFGLTWFWLILAVILAATFILSLVMSPIYIAMVVMGLALLSRLFFLRSPWSLWGLTLLIGVFISAFAFTGQMVFSKLKPTHQNRLLVLLDPTRDPRGQGWNVTNSKMALSGGGVAGKGFMKGTLTQLKFVPKQHTDFIFSAIGEQWGFMGTTLLVSLFLTLMVKVILAAERQKTAFARVYGYCVASVLFFHFFMNIGTAIGLVPTVGVPLPFISYGGSSLLGFTVLLFTFIRMDAYNSISLR